MNLDEVLENIKDPHRWVTDPEALIDLLKDVPSLRGMAYGNYAEAMFLVWLMKHAEVRGVTDISRDDDHKKTKSDRTFKYGGRVVTVQNKSMQTNSIKAVKGQPGHFTARIQNDASDARDIELWSGHVVHTTCYKVSEYDILAVPLQPFTGDWDTFAFKKNTALPRSESNLYTTAEREMLLATLVPIQWPLDDSWTTELWSLLPGEITPAAPVTIETDDARVTVTGED